MPAKGAPRPGRREEGRIDQRIHHLRMLRQDIREPRRIAENEPDQDEQSRVLPQQREQPPAPARMKLRQETVEHDEGEFAMLAFRELIEQMRNEIHQLAAREFSAQGRITPGEPASDGRGDFQRVAETEFRETIQCRAIVGFAFEKSDWVAGERPTARTGSSNGPAPSATRDQRVREILPVRKATKLGEAFDCGGVRGNVWICCRRSSANDVRSCRRKRYAFSSCPAPCR